MTPTIHIFPEQGSQFPGMGRDLYESSAAARDLFERANQVLGFRLTDVMFSGSEEDLRRTEITQPAIFLHSVVAARVLFDTEPVAVAGHSLGEYAALVAAGVLSLEDGLRLVSIRARAMQRACEEHHGVMAVVLALAVRSGCPCCCSWLKKAKRAFLFVKNLVVQKNLCTFAVEIQIIGES